MSGFVTSVEAAPQIVVNRQTSIHTSYEGAHIDASEVYQGCPQKDCIPSINKPKFETAKKAKWLSDGAVVFGFLKDGEARAYPQQILNWHEIVNDRIGKSYFAITFCPLCGSAVAFERSVTGVVTEFGVSGQLHKSDLLMYDRFEGNLWQQITEKAVVGPAARRNEKLKLLSLATTTWGE
ncbi:MAG: hypothetical protein ACI9BD_001267 [Candidatus Marinamargulisbacteria bacterium]|jgi:hypothetical protein